MGHLFLQRSSYLGQRWGHHHRRCWPNPVYRIDDRCQRSNSVYHRGFQHCGGKSRPFIIFVSFTDIDTPRRPIIVAIPTTLLSGIVQRCSSEFAPARVISNKTKHFIFCFLEFEETRLKIVKWINNCVTGYSVPMGVATVIESFRDWVIISSRIFLMIKTPRRTHKSIPLSIFEGNPKRTARYNFQMSDFLPGGSDTVLSRVVSNKPGKV